MTHSCDVQRERRSQRAETTAPVHTAGVTAAAWAFVAGSAFIVGCWAVLAVQIVRKRTVLTARASMARVQPVAADGAPIACGLRLREPAYYAALYPISVCRISPKRIAVLLHRRGWTFDKDLAAVEVRPCRIGSKVRLSQEEVVLDVWVIGPDLAAVLGAAGWKPTPAASSTSRA